MRQPRGQGPTRVIGAVVIAACVMLVGCATDARPSLSTDQVLEVGPLPSFDGSIERVDSVVVVGDSITDAAADEILSVLTSGGVSDLVIDGVASRRIEVGNGTTEPLAGVRTLKALVESGAAPDVWVIALGTNDITSYNGVEEYGGLVDQMLALLPPDSKVVWIDTYMPLFLDLCQQFNEAMRNKLTARGNAVVGSWLAVASAPGADLLRNDLIHPNEAGRRAFATLIANAVSQVA